jgi:hypothetical protein
MDTVDATSVLLEWAPDLAKRLARSEAQIRAHGLTMDDFSPHRSVDLKFPDGSHARFLFAFAVASAERHAVAVFTEHYGSFIFRMLPEMPDIEVHEDVYIQA